MPGTEGAPATRSPPGSPPGAPRGRVPDRPPTGLDVRSERVRVPPPCPIRPRCTMPGTEGTLGASSGFGPRAHVRIQGQNPPTCVDVRSERAGALAHDPHAPHGPRGPRVAPQERLQRAKRRSVDGRGEFGGQTRYGRTGRRARRARPTRGHGPHEPVQAWLTMPCLGLVTDFPLIRWASRASDGTQGPSGRWSESLSCALFEKISPRLRTPFSAASTRRLGHFHDRSHGPPCPRGPD